MCVRFAFRMQEVEFLHKPLLKKKSKKDLMRVYNRRDFLNIIFIFLIRALGFHGIIVARTDESDRTGVALLYGISILSEVEV